MVNSAATCYQNLRKRQPFRHPFTQLAVLFVCYCLVCHHVCKGPAEHGKPVPAVPKQKGENEKLYGTETVGYFDTDNMSQLVFYLFSYLYLVFTCSVSKVLFVQQEGGMQERAGN